MSAGGVAVHHHALPAAAPEKEAGVAHLLENAGDANLRAQVVADDRDAHALCVRPLGHVVEALRRQRTPPAAVDENGERRRAGVAFGGKEVDDLLRRWAEGKAEFRVTPLFAARRAIAQPVGKNLYVLRHAGAIVVFLLVIDRHFFPRCYRQECDRRPGETRRQRREKWLWVAHENRWQA